MLNSFYHCCVLSRSLPLFSHTLHSQELPIRVPWLQSVSSWFIWGHIMLISSSLIYALLQSFRGGNPFFSLSNFPWWKWRSILSSTIWHYLHNNLCKHTYLIFLSVIQNSCSSFIWMKEFLPSDLISCYVIIPSSLESDELEFLTKTFISFLNRWILW